MCIRAALLLALSLVLSSGCDSKKDETSPQNAPEPPVAQAKPVDRAMLVPQARALVETISALEKEKDVTCWTSFRQLDQFIATKSYSDFASIAKIQSQKSLTFAVWEAASKRPGDRVTGADIDAVIELRDAAVSDEERARLESFASELGLKDFDDYRKTGEHYRVLLAATMDAVAHDARVFEPLDETGRERLADVIMQLSLELLKESGKVATEERSPFIEAKHVKRAHSKLAKDYGLEPASPLPAIKDPAGAARLLAPVTKELIDAKVGALKYFNKNDPRSPLETDETLRALNEVSPTPVTQEGLDNLLLQLRSVARFVAGGLEPMRSDNYLSDGQFEPKKLRRKLYVDEEWTENVIMQVWPHVVMPNGDIKLRIEPNPGTISDQPREPRDVLLLDYQQNAVRDSAVHWEILQREFGERPFAMDPFAAEFFSEVLSMMLTHYLFEGARIAEKMGKETIDADVARRVRDPRYVQVMPTSEEFDDWGEEQEKLKADALSAYDSAVFADISGRAGLPTRLELDAIPDDVIKRGDIQRPMGAGIAVGDIDGDGFPDLFMSGEGLGRLYRNRGDSAPGRFEDVTSAWKLPEGMHDSRGAVFFDLEGDGDHDLLVLRSSAPSHLFVNEGDGFVDKTTELGLKTMRGAHVATVFDFDGDQDLDIYVGYYGSHAVNSGESKGRSLPAIDGRNGSPNQLWRNDGGTFVEVGKKAGVADVGWTLAASTFDYDKDGDLDLYIANDFGGNAFFRNDGGTFAEVSRQNHTHDRGSGMNVSFADIDADGWFDLFLTNIDMFSKSIKVIFPTERTTVDIDESLQKSFQYIAGNKLYRNVGADEGRAFESVDLEMFEPGDQGWAWDGNFFDADHDGDEDLYVANGWIDGSYAADQSNLLFLRQGGHFFRAPASWPSRFKGNSRAVAAVDIDRDGDLDLIVNNFRQPPRVLENTTDDKRWVSVVLEGKGGMRTPAGAVVMLETARGVQRRQVTVGRGYLSQDDIAVHFGLGEPAGEATLTITWPDGSTAQEKVTAGQRVTFKQSP